MSAKPYPFAKRPLRFLKALGLFFGVSISPICPAIDVGDQAPAISLPTSKGQLDLATLAGKVIYVDFWASWCGPCRNSFPWMNEIQEKYASHGLVIIGVNLDAKQEDAKRFLDKTPARFAIAFDDKGTTPRTYGVKGMPTSVLIDRHGKIISTHLGFNNSHRDDLEKQIRVALENHQ